MNRPTLSRRVFASNDPQRTSGPIQPMSKEDRQFWALFAKRKEAARG